jgi:hypothetical protein
MKRLLMSALALGIVSSATMAHATRYSWLQNPGSACQPLEDEYDLGHNYMGLWNRSNSATIVHCPVQLENQYFDGSYAGMNINDVYIRYYDGSPNQSIVCTPYAVNGSGGVVMGAAMTSAAGIEYNSFTWWNPFNGIDLTKDHWQMTIRCQFPSNQSYQSGLFDYQFTVAYPNRN